MYYKKIHSKYSGLIASLHGIDHNTADNDCCKRLLCKSVYTSGTREIPTLLQDTQWKTGIQSDFVKYIWANFCLSKA